MNTVHRQIAICILLLALAIPGIIKKIKTSGQKKIPSKIALVQNEHCTHNILQKAPPGRRLLCNKGIDVNNDDASTISFLPGIGKTRALAIVEYRKKHGFFKTPQHLTQIRGIGTKTLDKIMPWLCMKTFEDIEEVEK